MLVERTAPNLTLPRYVPLALPEVSLAAWYDCRKDRYVVVCPECQRLITYDGYSALYRAIVASERGCCQGCRAKVSFLRNPDLIGMILDFWYRKDAFPQSSSWVDAIPRYQCNLWAKEIQAGLEAATAPMMCAS